MREKERAAFVSKMAAFSITSGMQPSVARLLAYLTVCEPAQQSAESMRTALHLSVGSISGAIATLRRIGLIQQTRLPNERRFYYELDSEGWMRATLQGFKTIEQAVAIAESGLHDAPDNIRLKAMYDIYTMFDNELAALKKRLTSQPDILDV